jgi:mevalonate kinase
MITGEHAVLHGAHAMVGAVDARVQVDLEPRPGRTVDIRSALGTRRMTLDAPDLSPPFQFVGHAIALFADRCQSGFALGIQAGMSADTGLGSSAAVTVATLTALHCFCHQAPPSSPDVLHRQALDIVRRVQGAASGADLAAAVWGGVLLYRQTPEVICRHVQFPPITLIYAGYKTPTAEVIRQVEARRAHIPDGFRALYARMDACSREANQAFASADWRHLADTLSNGHCLMEELGVCDPTLAAMIRALREQPGIAAAKISGSGMGDCVLAIGKLPCGSVFPYSQIPVQFSTQGVMLESVCIFD